MTKDVFKSFAIILTDFVLYCSNKKSLLIFLLLLEDR
jgi:hypothetical protein